MGNHMCECLWELLTDDRAYFVLCFCTDGGSVHGGKTHLLLGSTFVYGQNWVWPYITEIQILSLIKIEIHLFPYLYINYFTYLFIHFVIRRNWKVGDSRLAQGLNCILAEDPWIFWTVPSFLLHLQSSCQHFRQIEGESTGASWFSFKRFLDKFHPNSSAHILLERIQWFPSSKGSEDSWTVVNFLFLLLFVLGRVFVYIYIWIVF